MNKIVGIAMLAFLACGQVQIVMSESIQAQTNQDRKAEANRLFQQGNQQFQTSQFEQAFQSWQQALTIYREIKDRLGEGSALGNLGGAYYSLGKYDKAIEFQLQSLAIYQEIKDRRREGTALGNLGIAYRNLGKYDKAIEFQLQSLAIAREFKDRRGEGILLNNLGGDFKNLKQPELAILFYKQSINVLESIRQEIRKLDKDIQKSYLENVSSSYKRLADILIQQDRIVEALQVIDLLKVQELEDYLKNIEGIDRSAQGVRLLAPEKAISDKLLAISFDNSKEINSQLANQIQKLPKSEINKVPEYLQKIPQGTALLYPLILSDRLEIILFSPNTIPISRSVKISKKELETLVTGFRAALRDAGSEDYKEPATKLYKLLIKPIEAELVKAKTTTILYAPDGILRYIPMASLYDGKQWLAEKYRISNLIAYSLFDFAPNLKIKPNILAGVFGDGVALYTIQKADAKNTIASIASLWSVDAAGTKALIEAFYGELKKGDVPIAEALRRAQVSLIKSPNYNHPNYWSAFFAISNGL